MNTKKIQLIHLRLKRELKKRLKIEAAGNGISINALAIIIFEEYLNKPKEEITINY